jgi:hypothetical protein
MKWYEPTAEQSTAWAEFLAERPAHVRAVAERFDPWTLYRLTTTGQRCSVIGFHEVNVEKAKQSSPGGCGVAAVPVTVYIRAENPTLGALSAVNVFGIDPAELVPWTEADEVTGALPSAFGEERYA